MKRNIAMMVTVIILIATFIVPHASSAAIITSDIGTLGGIWTYPSDINNLGQVVGASLTADGKQHAFLWTEEDGMMDLGTLGGYFSTAYGINDKGQVVGTSMTTSNEVHAFLWTAEGGMMDLDTLGGIYSYAYDINNLGQVVGHIDTGSFWNPAHAFIWTLEDGMVGIPELDRARAINDKGQVVGTGQNYHACIWTAEEGIVDLGTLGGEASYGWDINNLGQVVGSSVTADSKTHAFLWTPEEGMLDLGVFGGKRTRALGINDLGQVIGVRTSIIDRDNAFIWTAENCMLILDSVRNYYFQNDINNFGQAVGMSGNNAVIWSVMPLPEKVIELATGNVDTLVTAGVLNQGNGNALTKKLNGALTQLERGNIKSATNKLNAFENQVAALLNTGNITQEEAQPLLDSAELIIIGLSGEYPEQPVQPEPFIRYSGGQFFLTDYLGRMSPTDYIMFASEGVAPEDGIRAPDVEYTEDHITAWGMVWYIGLSEGLYYVTVHAGDPLTNPPLFDALPIEVPDPSGGL